MTKIIVIGDIVTDIVAAMSRPLPTLPDGAGPLDTDSGASIIASGGGSGANTAAWLAAAGVDVTLCGVIGDDDAGDIRLAELDVRGVTCSIRREPEAATGTIIALTYAGQRAVIADRGANALLSYDDVDAALAGARGAVHLHLSGYALLDAASRPAALHALRQAAEHGLTTSVAAPSAGALRAAGSHEMLEWVRATDALFTDVATARMLLRENPDDKRSIIGDPDTESAEAEVLARRLAPYCGIAILRLGASGAVSHVVGSHEVLRVPIPELAAPDLGGVGDAFAAGYLAAWLAGASGRDALGVATEMGSLAVGPSGPQSTL